MKVIRHYKWHTGTFAFALHRLSGLALLAYLPMHIYVTGRLTDSEAAFETTMQYIGTPLFHFLEWGLFGVILYHSLNGLRLLMVDLGVGSGRRGQKAWFWAFIGVGLAAWLVSAPILMKF